MSYIQRHLICHINNRVSENVLHINRKVTLVIRITKSRFEHLVIGQIKGLGIILSGKT